MKVLDNFIESTTPPDRTHRVLWVNPENNKLKYYDKNAWVEIDCTPETPENPVENKLKEYVGIYKQTHSGSTVYPTNWPQLELYLKEDKLMCSAGLFGGPIGMEEIELKYDESNDILIFEASTENPIFHNELGSIVNNVYFKKGDSDLILYAYSNKECTNTTLVLTEYGGTITNYKLKKQ